MQARENKRASGMHIISPINRTENHSSASHSGTFSPPNNIRQAQRLPSSQDRTPAVSTDQRTKTAVRLSNTVEYVC